MGGVDYEGFGVDFGVGRGDWEYFEGIIGEMTLTLQVPWVIL